jgi:hypothetical protein
MAFRAARPYRTNGRVWRGWAPWLALLLATAAVGTTQACGTDAVGVDSCTQIEEARCRQAPACAIGLEPPYHTSGGDVEACIRFYDVACLHGLDVSDPGPTAVHACVAAIEKDGCGTVTAPETDPACAWLSSVPLADAGDGSPVAVDAAVAE